MPAVIARRLHGTPFVTTYGFWYARLARTRLTRILGAAVERVGLAAADAVIVTTPELGRHVRARQPRARVHLVPNGVDTELFVPGPPRDRAEPPTVLYLGRLSAEKNVEALLEAAGKLVARTPLRLRIVGDGPRRAALAARAAALRIPVDFHAFVDHARVPGLLAAADAFVLPSFTEGHPKALLEAMSAGIPCVASDIPGTRAVVTEGETALLFDPHDAHALADRLEQVLGDADLARALGANARAAARARFDLGTLVQREIEILRAVAGRV
jgi:glycosyltransferase involved in cell wall biosynthesis